MDLYIDGNVESIENKIHVIKDMKKQGIFLSLFGSKMENYSLEIYRKFPLIHILFSDEEVETLPMNTYKRKMIKHINKIINEQILTNDK
jgi:hypothetical protein